MGDEAAARTLDVPAPHDGVADALLEGYLDPASVDMQHIGSYELPTEVGVEKVVEMCRELLFPGYTGTDVPRSDPAGLRALVRARLDRLWAALHGQLFRALHHKHRLKHRGDADAGPLWQQAETIASRFVGAMPQLREALCQDLRAAFRGDPAASGVDEILLTYPSTYAITTYRLANLLLREGAVVIPRMMTELAHRRTGIDLHPGASIGSSFFIDHGTGVVIGETSVIGNGVRIYQGVTLGALSVPQGETRPAPGVQRHPTIEDDVVIYANATILGGKTVIGKGSVIGGNAFITASVPPGTKVGARPR
jgi:serine O-acetyltransferase